MRNSAPRAVIFCLSYSKRIVYMADFFLLKVCHTVMKKASLLGLLLTSNQRLNAQFQPNSGSVPNSWASPNENRLFQILAINADANTHSFGITKVLQTSEHNRKKQWEKAQEYKRNQRNTFIL